MNVVGYGTSSGEVNQGGDAPQVPVRDRTATRRLESDMILLGVVLLIIGFIAKIAIVWAIGILLVLVGLALVLLGALGRAVGGRRHYY